MLFRHSAQFQRETLRSCGAPPMASAERPQLTTSFEQPPSVCVRSLTGSQIRDTYNILLCVMSWDTKIHDRYNPLLSVISLASKHPSHKSFVAK